MKLAAGSTDGTLPVIVRAKLAMLNKQWAVAESLLLAQGLVDEVIMAYQQSNR